MRGSIERPRRNDENDGTRGTMSLKRTELAPKADDTGVLCVLCVLCHYKSEGHGLILAGIGVITSLTSLGAASGRAAFYYHDRRPPSGGITPDQVFYPDLTC